MHFLGSCCSVAATLRTTRATRRGRMPATSSPGAGMRVFIAAGSEPVEFDVSKPGGHSERARRHRQNRVYDDFSDRNDRQPSTNTIRFVANPRDSCGVVRVLIASLPRSCPRQAFSVSSPDDFRAAKRPMRETRNHRFPPKQPTIAPIESASPSACNRALMLL